MSTEKWWKNGLIIAGGWHPLGPRIRSQIPSEDIEAEYAWEYTEEHILRLKELGITLLVGQFDRGLGESDQQEAQELARVQAELCHKHGIRHGVYMPNTVYYESVLKDNPECEDWCVKTSDGRKTYYGGEQTWRWVACMNSPGWRRRMKREIEKAITCVKTDLLHFDNLGQSLEPDSCNCDYCQKKFREFLLERYPDAESQRRRFGYEGFDTFRIPVFWDNYTHPWDLDRFQTPLLQEWLMFRNAVVTDYIADMSQYAHELKPDIALNSNGQAIHGNNTGLTQGRGDFEAQVAHVDTMWEENPDWRPDDDVDAIPKSCVKFRVFLFGAALDKQLITHYRTDEELAFNITFSSNPGINAHWGYAEPGRMPLNAPQPGVKALLDHYIAHKALYTHTSPAARIALWRNPQSLLYVSSDTHLSACVMEQVLFNHNIPFSIVQDGFICKQKLLDFDLLILPDVEFISDEKIRVIKDFVENGGRLLITERSGIYTDYPRQRKSSPFAFLFGTQFQSASSSREENLTLDETNQFSMKFQGGNTAFAEFGRGRVAYLPKVEYRYLPGTFKSGYNRNYDGIDSRYWKNPRNTREILSLLDWLYRDLYPVRVVGADNIHLNYLNHGNSKIIRIFRSGELKDPVDIPLFISEKVSVKSLNLFTPENKKSIELEYASGEDGKETILRNIGRHAFVQVS